MLFPNDAKEIICKGIKCPNTNERTLGVCIQKKGDKYVYSDSEKPSVIILFRDPTIQDSNPDRIIKHVLDIEDPKDKIKSTLFTFYKTYFLDFFPENEIIYLDNCIRCKMPFTTKQLKSDFLKLSDPYASCCYKISKAFLGRLPNLKCLIISDVKSIIWLGKKGFFTNLNNSTQGFIDKYEENKSNQGNSTILLNQSLQLKDFNFPVFFFMHPNTLQLQQKYYAPGEKYNIKFECHRNMILDILNVG